jgi:hypothetical protein
MTNQPDPYICPVCGQQYVVRVLAADCAAKHTRGNR